MAEVEHFMDPSDKTHKKFHQIENVEVVLFTAKNQIEGKSIEKIKIGDAVKNVKKYYC